VLYLWVVDAERTVSNKWHLLLKAAVSEHARRLWGRAEVGEIGYGVARATGVPISAMRERDEVRAGPKLEDTVNVRERHLARHER
jgi:hypothetical protein